MPLLDDGLSQWKSVGADFSAGNNLMRGASESFSRAGDVFGKLRQSILDEEQRAVDNQFKERQAQLAEAGHELNVRKQDHTEEEAKKMHERWKKTFDEGVRQYNTTHKIEVDKVRELQANGLLSREKAELEIGVIKNRLKKQAQIEFVNKNYKDVLNMSDEQFAALKNTYSKEMPDSFRVFKELKNLKQDSNMQSQFSSDTGMLNLLGRLNSSLIEGSNAGLAAGAENEKQAAIWKREDEQNYIKNTTEIMKNFNDVVAKKPEKEQGHYIRFFEYFKNGVEQMQGYRVSIEQLQQISNITSKMNFSEGMFSNGHGLNILNGKNNKDFTNLVKGVVSIGNPSSPRQSTVSQNSNKKVVNLAGSEIEKKGYDDYKKQISGIADINKLNEIKKNLVDLKEKTKDPEQKKLVDKYSAVITEQAEKIKAKQQKNSK